MNILRNTLLAKDVLFRRTLCFLVLPFILLAACAPGKTVSFEPTQPATATQLPESTQATALPSEINILLGRPTTNSIAFALLSKSAKTILIEYGLEPGIYTLQSDPITLEPGTPAQVELGNLRPDTAYYYAIDGIEHTFHTARLRGSSYTFTVDADPHSRDPRFSGELYTLTMKNALASHPDFHIDLGDTFMTEKLQPKYYKDVESSLIDMVPYFGVLSADAPLFLVNGNHEGELGWLKTQSSGNNPLWSVKARQLYFPNPVPGDFYSGTTTIDPLLMEPRDGYYSWTWGDALFVVLDPFWYTEIKPSKKVEGSGWNWTLGRDQYDWLKRTLETSESSYKFIFIHHLVGGSDEYARGGIEYAGLWEWGGNNPDGTPGFDDHRPGWGVPIHQLLVQNHVSAVFHGHDHVFVQQELDGIIYQELPQPSNAQSDNHQLAGEYGYTHGKVVPGSGFLRISVSADTATVDFVLSSLVADQNDKVVYSYTIRPNHE